MTMRRVFYITVFVIISLSLSIPSSMFILGHDTISAPRSNGSYGIDYIRVRTGSDNSGEQVTERTYSVGETDTLYLAGYNDTHGYVKDVNVSGDTTYTDFLQVTAGDGYIELEALGQGSGTITLQSGDIEITVDITVLSDSPPEITTPISDVDLVEDFGVHKLDLESHASDDEDDISQLRWFVTGYEESKISIGGQNQAGNHVLSLISRSDQSGNMLAKFNLMDSDGNIDTQNVWIRISPVNDAPVISPVPNLYVHYDEPYDFDYSPYVSDIETPKIGLDLSTDVDQYTSVNGLIVTFEYPEIKTGEESYVRISVSDGEKSTSQLVKVTVTSDYPPEKISSLPDVTINENETRENVFDLDDYIMDPDEDSLYYSYGYSHLTIDIGDDHTVDITAESEWTGTEKVTFRAEDPIGAIVEQTINVEVIPVNDPPVLKKLDPFVVHYENSYTFDLAWYISDNDNSLSELSVYTSKPEYVTVQGTELSLFYPESIGSMSYPYTVPLTVSVFDGIDTVFQSTTVTVMDNYAPDVQKSIGNISFDEDEELIDAIDLDNFFVDVDSNTIYYTSGHENVQIAIDGSSVALSASEDWHGTEHVKIRATDEESAFVEESFYVTVIPVNDPPVIESIPDQKNQNKTTWILDLSPYISDVDNHLEELSLTVDSSYVDVVGLKLLFSYPEDVKQDKVTITVSDGDLEVQESIDVSMGPTSSRILPFDDGLLLYLIPIAAGAAVAGGWYLLKKRKKYVIEDVFLIQVSGVLIKHTTRTLRPDRDEDILAGMFTAVQRFIKDSFAEDESDTLRSMEYGDNKVVIHKGDAVILSVFFREEEPDWMRESMENFVQDVEERYGEDVADWNGSMESLPGLGKMLNSFVESKGKYKSGDWKKEKK
ncbi:MAG: hypothetical protein R6U61_00325 [Thermoplasmata archaeon]